MSLGKAIIYHLATRGRPDLEGTDWEAMFAKIVGARWKPSNNGLDDIVLKQTAWGAKTVKTKDPFTVGQLRLISGRNSLAYSFGVNDVSKANPNDIGKQILEIWNERVSGIRKLYKHLRTVVLIKSDDLLKLSVFEYDTARFEPSDYAWKWNSQNNLEGHIISSGQHKFTWQPHGAQFTVKEDVPINRLSIRVKKPPIISEQGLLNDIKFLDTWVQII